MQLVIELSDDDIRRAKTALGSLWALNDETTVERDVERTDNDGKVVVETLKDIIKTPRIATDSELVEFCLKQLRGMVRQREALAAGGNDSPVPFAGK